MKDQGVFNDTPAAETTAAAPAAPVDDAVAATEAAEGLKNAARAAGFGERVDARVEDNKQHESRRYHYVRPPRTTNTEARPKPPWDDAKPFPSYEKYERKVDDILYQYKEPLVAIDVQRLSYHVQGLFNKVTADWKNPWEILGFYHLLDSFADAFAVDKFDLGKCSLAPHHIDTGNERPFKQRLRRFPLAQQEDRKAG